MTSTGQSSQRQLDLLITQIAGDLMGASLDDAPEAMAEALSHLLEFFGADQSFLRRNDHQAGTSVLMAEWPQRLEVPDPDPLYEVPFSADPIFGMCAELAETFIAYPDDSADYQERVKAGSGQDNTTMAMVPLRADNVTIGVLGLIRFDSRRFEEDEVTTLGAIASLLAQLWGRHDAERVIAYQAHYDELTGLANRRVLAERLENMDVNRSACLLVMDIDNMKVINDGLTFDAGNQFLVALATRLASTVRPNALVARLSGDQFGVLLTDISVVEVEPLANRLLAELARPVQINGVAIARSVSLGAAHRTAGERDRNLLTNADLAMFEAKKAGKNRAIVFDENMQAQLLEQFEVELELRQAIEAQDQLLLHYQPEVDLQTGQIMAVEALLRWNHPVRGLLNAGLFITAAEESGLIVEIGDQVLDLAIRQLALWQDAFPELTMRVNVSPAQLINRDLATQIRGLVNKYGANPHRLCIEVTEHVMVADNEFTMDLLDEIQKMGIKIALDDFGTGYSSMTQLKRLPIDALKIDIAFISGLGVSKRDEAIVDASIGLAEAFGLDTVAEGIEEEQQVIELLHRGCHRAQGYLLARPQDPADIEALLGKPVWAGSIDLATMVLPSRTAASR